METTTHPFPVRSCGVSAAIDLVGDRWSLLIVREVLFGNSRFSGIVEALGAPRDRIAARLKLLVEAGVLQQRAYQTVPLRSEYLPTAAGIELAPVIATLFDWGVRWGHVSEQCHTLLHRDHALQPTLVCAECGEPVRPADLSRIKPGFENAAGEEA